MSRQSLSTPCPAPHSSFGLRRPSTASLGVDAQDDTADLEYTRAITQEFKNAKPRRRSTFQRPQRKAAPITIFEDVEEDQELAIAETRREIGGSTLLGKAARKMPRSSMARHQETIVEEEPAQEETRYNRRVSTLADSIPGLRFKMPEPAQGASQESKLQGGLKKDPRRRTIFVPSDDTTIMTIHPGANNTDRLNDTFQLPSMPEPQPPVSESQPLREKVSPKPATKRPRMSLAVAPKRAPLQQMAAEKGNIPATDVPGKNGGKENLPPRSQAPTGEKKPISRLLAPTAASQARESIQARSAVHPPSNLRRTRPVASGAKPSQASLHGSRRNNIGQSSYRSSSQITDPPSARSSVARQGAPDVRKRSSVAPAASQPTSSLVKPRLQPTKRGSPSHDPAPATPKDSKLHQYPVLPGDLSRPELYEDDWLRHQEVVLTEVINELMASADHRGDQWRDPAMSRRERLIELYHEPFVSNLHQRLQASLQYGALSLPKDSAAPTLSHDIGLRRRYLNLWLDTYDEGLLKDAAEVVVGRQIPESCASNGHASIESTYDPHHGRRSLVAFLETFFVEAEDATSDLEASKGPWRKMVARSLMLIWLLDQAKGSQAISGCLFKKSSSRKSSMQVLNHLATIVLPSSIGDVTRAFGHFDYAVPQQQDPLDEVTYKIENLASDMRDGIRLCRLVEMLLYPKDPNRLSQHLKMPCLGRAQKLFNVDIALSALQDVGPLRTAVRNVTADDIVNGHREKTLSLLWSLVSTHGMDALLDFKELMADIRRNDASIELPLEQQYLAQHQQEELLHAWATAICAERDIQVTNMTTSFADGRAYAAIVEDFAPFCMGSAKPRSSGNASAKPLASINRSCSHTLRALGCSTAFTTFLTSSHTLPSRQTTISNLLFLASRLLPLKRRHNAAVIVQRAFRLRRSRMIVSQRVKLMRLAHACATVVQTRNRVIDAAVVLQRAWRRVVEARIGRLNSLVEGFQGVARGWMARRTLNGKTAQGRVMGGW